MRQNKLALFTGKHFSYCDVQSQAQLLDRGLLLGDGLFETLLYKDGTIEFFDEHWDRLHRGAELLQIPLTERKGAIAQVIHNLYTQNCSPNSPAAIRVTLTRGPGNRGVLPPKNADPSLFIQCTPYQHPKKSFYTLTYSQVIHNEYSPFNHIKTNNYLEKIYARMQADAAGYDDAILLNTKGEVVSTTCANIFFSKNNQLFTPHLASGALPGVIREHLIHKTKPSIIETAIFPQDLQQADAIFITNSLMKQMNCVVET